jgi:hypothetical protein
MVLRDDGRDEEVAAAARRVVVKTKILIDR